MVNDINSIYYNVFNSNGERITFFRRKPKVLNTFFHFYFLEIKKNSTNIMVEFGVPYNE